MKRIALALAIAAAVVGYNASEALAVTPGWECIPTTAGQAVVSGGTGATPACGAGSTAVLAPTFVSSGVGGKPTVQFASVNVQIISGSGSTDGTVNGTGNLVVGYEENANNFSRTGSNNLIVGADNGWTSSGGIIGGDGNFSSGAGAVLFGMFNTATGSDSFIGGGCGNLAGGSGKPFKKKCPTKGTQAILGGHANQATAGQASIAGGQFNLANDLFASVAGGCSNIAGPGSPLSGTCTAGAEAVLGGFENSASGLESTVSGGNSNSATGNEASVLGGDGNSAASNCQAIPAAPGTC